MIFHTETIRYADKGRWGWNNGFRQRWLANGASHAGAINAARRGDLDALLAHAATLGGLSQRMGWAKSALRAAAKLAADVPSYRIITTDRGEKIVTVPTLSWTFRSGRSRAQIAEITWLPMWGVNTRKKSP